MARGQVPIYLNERHNDLINKFKQEIIELEGTFYGNFGDYVADAMDFYLHYMKHFPEKIGKERHTISNLSKTQQRTNQFIEFAGETLRAIKDQGLDYLAFRKLLQSCFQKGEKTLRTYEKEILLNASWSIINIPQSNKKIVLHTNSNIYDIVQRFDMTKGNYYSGLRPNKNEDVVFSQIRKRLMPQKEDTVVEVLDEGDSFISSLGGVEQ